MWGEATRATFVVETVTGVAAAGGTAEILNKQRGVRGEKDSFLPVRPAAKRGFPPPYRAQQ